MQIENSNKSKKRLFIVVTVIGVTALAAGIGVLIWWLVAGREEFSTVVLEGDGLGVTQSAGFTRIRRVGDMFWWFYPTVAANLVARPIVLWLDGVTGLPPSLLANFGMFGPFDFNLDPRNDSWIDEYNLLFVDAPLGTGFSTTTSDSRIPTSLDENIDHLIFTLESFYSLHEQYADTPLYIFGQGHGAQLALALATRLHEIVGDAEKSFSCNLTGVVLANGVVSPALALTKLGFYLDEMGYVDGKGREVVEDFSNRVNAFVDNGQYGEAYDLFLTLEDVVNEEAGAIAVNLGHIVEKLTRDSSRVTDNFGQKQYLRSVFGTDMDFNEFMIETVAPAIGISGSVYDQRREAAVQAFRDSFMVPAVELVENILRNTNLDVTIYNGNLDAVSTTPGQLEWVNNLIWPGQEEFMSSPRQTLVVEGLVQGYFRESDRLKFYWMNAAGQSVPLDSPSAMRRVLQRITHTQEDLSK